jgi:nucleotide-binding universal stress UspA family protein
MKRIVVAVDGSTPSLKAVDLAADLASKYDAELALFAVVQEYAPVISADLTAYARAENIKTPFVDAGLARAQTALADARLAAQGKGATRVSTKSDCGDPAAQIVAFADDQHADLIVMGSRGHGRLAGLLLGSVAQKVLGHAMCPVLVVR